MQYQCQLISLYSSIEINNTHCEQLNNNHIPWAVSLQHI